MVLSRLLLIFLLLLNVNAVGQGITPKECDNLIEEGITLMFEKKHGASLELLLKARTLAADNHWYRQEFRAVLNTGSNYYLMADLGEALSYYLQAYAIAIEHLEVQEELTVLNNIGILYFQENNLPKAKEFFEKAYDLSLKGDANSKRGYYAINLALVHNKMRLPDKALSYIKEALPLVEKEPEVSLMAQMAKAENLYIRKNFTESKILLTHLLSETQGESNVENRVFVLLLLFQVALEENNPELSLHYATQARSISRGMVNGEEIFSALSTAYANLKEYDKALLYKDSILIAKDSLQNMRNAALFENNKIKFELQSYTRDLKESRLLLEKERRFFLMLTTSIIILLLLLLWIFRIYISRHSHRKKIAELELEQEKTKRWAAEKQMREQEALDQLEREKLKNELDTQNRKLTSKALYLSSRNELIQEVVDALVENPQIKSQPKILDQIKELSRHLKRNPQLDSFFSHFDEVNPGFTNRLLELNSNLTQQDIRFVIYLYMNLGHNEIASLLNISPQSCRKRKERLIKKLRLPEGQSLAAFIAGI